MGKMVAASKAEASQEIREMVTPTIRKNLEKQGYKIIGSHSGVKLCRWTKVNEIIMKWLILFSKGGCLIVGATNFPAIWSMNTYTRSSPELCGFVALPALYHEMHIVDRTIKP